jgi:hypothetical protein
MWSDKEATEEIVLAGERSDGEVVREGERGGAREGEKQICGRREE